MTVLQVITLIAGIVVALAVILWLGLRIKPAPFPTYPDPTGDLPRVPLREGLPAPVRRFYEVISGEQILLIHSAVFGGHGQLRFMGITFPARWRFIHDAGRGYRHHIELIIWGISVLTVHETFLDGNFRMVLPMGTEESQPRNDLAANLGLWGESLFLPSIYVTDPRVHWEAIDAEHARLIVPFGDDSQTDSFTVTFDPVSGLITAMETMRFQQPTDTEKQPWRLEPQDWARMEGLLIPQQATVTWVWDGSPWLTIAVEEIVYNIDVSDYIRAEGV